MDRTTQQKATDMRRLKVIQFNVDRYKEAMLLVEKEYMENYDVAILQEPYNRHEYNGRYSSDSSKLEI